MKEKPLLKRPRSVIAPRSHKPGIPMKDQNKYKSTFHIILQNIPSDTKLNFKAACVRQGKSMRDVMILLMRGYTRKYLFGEKGNVFNIDGNLHDDSTDTEGSED